jgi:quercetin dioxygenase-like cupin family protein
MKVVMDDGREAESGPGDAVIIPPGHNAWVVGNEPYIAMTLQVQKSTQRVSSSSSN